MPKMRTRRALAKRFSLTGSGRIKRRKANLRHILEKKSPKRKALAGKNTLAHRSDERQIKRALGC